MEIILVRSIKCWDCRSDNDPKCADPFDNSTLDMKDCVLQQKLPQYPDLEATMCRKIRQKVHGEWRYIRSCAFIGEPGIEGDERFCLMRTGSYNIFIEYCTCNSKDGCNEAPSSTYHHPSLVLGTTIFSLLTAILLKI